MAKSANQDQLDIQQQINESLLKTIKNYRDADKILEKMNLTTDLMYATNKKLSKEETTKRQIAVDIEKSLNRIKTLQSLIVVQGVGWKKAVRELADEHYNINNLLETQRNLNIQIETAATKIAGVLRKFGLGKLIDGSKALLELWKNPMFAVLSSVLYVSKQIWDAFVSMDKAAANFRRTLGITRKDSELLEESVRGAAFQYARLGVTADNLYNSFKEVAFTIGTSHAATKDMAVDMSILAVQVGVAEKTSAEFLKTLGMVGKVTMDSQRDMLYFAQAMSTAAGTPLSEVMNEIAAAAKSSYQFLSRNPLILIKSAIEAKKMGTNLESSTKTAANILRFTESVKSEMEASVLLGESINLQRARELSYRRNLLGLNQEILKIAKQTNFENLDIFQQEAIANALGKSADEIGQMLQAERERLNILKNPALSKQRQDYEKMRNANESLARASAADAKIQLTRLSNQEALKAISFAWISIMQRFGEVILPGIAWALTGIAKILNWISEKMNGFGKTINLVIALLTIAASVTALWLGAKGLGGLLKMFGSGLGSGIGSFFSGLSKGISSMGEPKVLLGAAAILILAASLIPLAYSMKLMEGVNWKTVGIIAVGLGLLTAAAFALGALMSSGVGALALLAGAAAIAILGAAMIPFAFAGKLAAQAMQMLGEVNWVNIAKGIFLLGIQSPLIALTGLSMLAATPGVLAFSAALLLFAFAANKAGNSINNVGMGFKLITDSIEKLQNISLFGTILQIRSLSKAVIELGQVLKSMPEIDVQKLEKIGKIGGNNSVNNILNTPKDDSMILELKGIKQELQQLRIDIGSGKLKASTTIDGQKVDSAIGRSLEFKGALV